MLQLQESHVQFHENTERAERVSRLEGQALCEVLSFRTTRCPYCRWPTPASWWRSSTRRRRRHSNALFEYQQQLGREFTQNNSSSRVRSDWWALLSPVLHYHSGIASAAGLLKALLMAIFLTIGVWVMSSRRRLTLTLSCKIWQLLWLVKMR